jgi:hypothetical protein
MATDNDPPLYLHVTATTQESLDKAVAKINELMEQELGPLTERPGFRERPERVSLYIYIYRFANRALTSFFLQRKWPETKLSINLESLRNFNVRAKVVGPQVSCIPMLVIPFDGAKDLLDGSIRAFSSSTFRTRQGHDVRSKARVLDS